MKNLIKQLRKPLSIGAFGLATLVGCTGPQHERNANDSTAAGYGAKVAGLAVANRNPFFGAVLGLGGEALYHHGANQARMKSVNMKSANDNSPQLPETFVFQIVDENRDGLADEVINGTAFKVRQGDWIGFTIHRIAERDEVALILKDHHGKIINIYHKPKDARGNFSQLKSYPSIYMANFQAEKTEGIEEYLLEATVNGIPLAHKKHFYLEYIGKQKPTFFSCNRYVDSDNNGTAEPIEFLGRKDTFSANEPVLVVAEFPRSYAEKKLTIKFLRSSTREEIFPRNYLEIALKSPGTTIQTPFNQSHLNQVLNGKDMEKMTIEWMIEGKQVGSYEVTIKKQ